MASTASAPTVSPVDSPIPAALLNTCFVLFVINAAFFPTAFSAHWWIFDGTGLGIPTDFVNVWAAGKLVLDGHPALAYDWGIEKQVQVAVLGQSYEGNFAWHYPPPFLFVAAVLARFPYAVAFIGWAATSFVPYLMIMRAIVGRPFGWLLAAAFPVVLTNTLVGQNGFLTAALIGGTLYLIPVRPVLASICLGLLSYKPQYGLLFPLVLIAASQWTVFIHGRGSYGPDGAGILARLRHRKLAGLLPLDADVFASLPHRRQGSLVEAAEPVFAGAVFWRQRTIGMGFPRDAEHDGRGNADHDVAQSYQLFIEGGGARDRRAVDHALSVHVRHDGTRDTRRLSGSHRGQGRFPPLRIAGAGMCNGIDLDLHVYRGAGRARRHPDRGGLDRRTLQAWRQA
jgi:Glycosyltransferase family 87